MGYVYLMESLRDYETVYKIGFSKNPKERKKSIQTGNDGEISIIHIFETKHGKKLENTLHNFYSHARINMEWFNLSLSEVIQFPDMCKRLEQNLEIIHNNSLEDFNIYY